MKLSEKVIAVTGAAGGIGAAIVERLVLEGARVIWTDIDHSTEINIKDSCKTNAKFFRQDVGSAKDWHAFEKVILSEYGKLDGLVNNAGLYRRETIADVNIESFRSIIRVNVEGVLLGCQSALRLMGEGGSIVNMASVAAMRPGSQSVSYGMSKAAVLNLTQAVARYCMDNSIKIRCNAICPGGVETPMSAKVFVGADPAAIEKRYKKTSILGRLAKPEELAGMAAFLLSDDAVFTTGASLVNDGGLLL